MVLTEYKIKVGDIENLHKGYAGAQNEHCISRWPDRHANYLSQEERHWTNCFNIDDRAADCDGGKVGRLDVVDKENIYDTNKLTIKMPRKLEF